MRPGDAAEAVVDTVRILSEKLGVPSGLGRLGVKPSDVDLLSENALKDVYITTNPRTVAKDDVRRICLAAL